MLKIKIEEEINKWLSLNNINDKPQIKRAKSNGFWLYKNNDAGVIEKGAKGIFIDNSCLEHNDSTSQSYLFDTLEMVAYENEFEISQNMQKLERNIVFNDIQEKILADLVLSNYGRFKKITQKNATKEFILECIKINASIVLTNFPYKFLELTKDISNEIINKNKALIDEIPVEHITIEIAKSVVEFDTGYLNSIPDVFKTKELFLLALSKNGCALKNIPFELRDMELCLKAIENDIYSFEYIPAMIKDVSFYEEALKINSSIKDYLPSYMKQK